jgi:Arginyl-tRNA synthetase
VEFVSANPTGPLHIGHVRGAIFGDALSRLLEYTGFIVTKEYYVNDGGAQIDVLGRTIYHRYLELQGDIADLPDEAYPGDYLVPVATALHEKYGDSLITMGVEERHALVCDFGISEMMQLIKNDLKSLDILMDNYFSEKTMIESGQIEKAIRVLEKKNLIYRGVLEAPKGKLKEDWKSREQILFKSTQFGDDMDRPIKKSDGSWTYFAPDLAYHGNKLNRKYDLIVDVLGADHSGYVNRIEAVVKALSTHTVDFKVKLIQLVRLLKNKKP